MVHGTPARFKDRSATFAGRRPGGEPMSTPPHLEAFLEKLRNVRPCGPGRWSASCPAHGGTDGDRNPSLSIGLGHGGEILLTCHVGCTYKEAVTAVGRKVADLFPAGPRSGGPGSDSQVERNPGLSSWQLRGMAVRFAHQLTADVRHEQAAALGLPAEALDALPLLGWNPDDPVGPCLVFPEVDGRGELCGLTRRYADGGKLAVAGSARGLTVPDGWRDRGGPVYLVEGPTDVLALTACGAAAIGRPSNTGGCHLYAQLLETVPAGTPIVAVGENDRKPDGAWPGRAGAEKVAGEIRTKLKRPIEIAYPPDDAKDARAWVVDQAAGAAEVVDWPAIGTEFAERLELHRAVRKGVRDWSKLFITSAEFAERDTRLAWLVKGVLVWNQPAVFGGPQKVLKTSMLVDLAVSLAAGLPFLGRFDTAGLTRVAMLSGESGEESLKQTAERVCVAKGTTLAALAGRVVWSFEVPALTDPDDLGGLVDYLAETGVKVAIVDPLYLALLAGGGDGPDARNLYEMGATLRRVAGEFRAAGITPILAHHANRQLPAGEPMELHHLSYSGIAEFARQWVLLSRRERYQGDGRHKLWLNVGGSAGQSGQWSADIFEGVVGDDFGGRVWEVEVDSLAGQIVTKQAEREQAERQKKFDEELAVMRAVDAENAAGNPATRSRLRTLTGFGDARVGKILERLAEQHLVVEVEFGKPGGRGATQPVAGFRRRSNEGD